MKVEFCSHSYFKIFFHEQGYTTALIRFIVAHIIQIGSDWNIQIMCMIMALCMGRYVFSSIKDVIENYGQVHPISR